MLAASYHSDLVADIKASEFTVSVGPSHHSSRARVRLLLRRRSRRRLRLSGAPAVSRSPGLPDRRNHSQPARQRSDSRARASAFSPTPGESIDALTPDDVVILPAFGITVELLETLVDRGCTLVDTTCGSVLNVWKNVKRYAERGLHVGDPRQVLARGDAGDGLAGAAASRAAVTTSSCSTAPKRRWSATTSAAADRASSSSHTFERRGVARLRPGPCTCSGSAAPTRRRCSARSRSRSARCSARRCATGTATTELDGRFRAFDTICSATQDRQDAIIALLATQPLDLMIVLGGYNSSNTCNLARICAERLPTYHIADPDGLVSASRDPPQASRAASTRRSPTDWLPSGPLAIGLTSGASTPDNLVEPVIRRLDTPGQRGDAGPGES